MKFAATSALALLLAGLAEPSLGAPAAAQGLGAPAPRSRPAGWSGAQLGVAARPELMRDGGGGASSGRPGTPERSAGHGASTRPRPLTGWAARLDVVEPDEEEEGHRLDPDDEAEVGDVPFATPFLRLADAEAASPLLAAAASVWNWLSSRVAAGRGGQHRHADVRTGADARASDARSPCASPSSACNYTASTLQNAPFFVAYGDRYYSTNSLGVPDPSQLQGLTHYNMAFYLASGPFDNALAWAQGSDAQRQAIVNAYAQRGIKLGVSVFGSTDLPQSNGYDPTQLARNIADFVRNNRLQGVDVDYEDLGQFNSGSAVWWLVALTRELRNQLPSPQYYISHAPLAPWFSSSIYPSGSYLDIDRQVGWAIDFYNTQFYNQNIYDTCNSLIWASNGWAPATSLFEIVKYGGVPINKLVVGKPAVSWMATNGYMSPQDMGNCLREALTSGWGWYAGFMFWEYWEGLSQQVSTVRSIAGF